MTRLIDLRFIRFLAALLIVGVLSINAVSARGADDGNQPPNIVLIMIDDLGWMDLACQGNERVSTPHIDRLAKQGMRFTDAYAAAPVCSPTRAAVLTGKSPARLRITNHIPDNPRFTPDDATLLPAEMHDVLALEHVTIAERLKQGGYATGFVGKWHLCGKWSGKLGAGDVRYHPEKQGFDINIGGCAMGGPPTFFDPYRIHNLPSRKPGEYLPYRLADESIAFMREAVGKGETPVSPKPFFLCLWPYTVHWPMEAPEELLAKYKGKEGRGLKDHRYGAMIEAMDASLGKVLAELDRLGVADNTLVIFTSDNGAFAGVADNRPLRGAKGELYEGGIRVPLIVRFPGVVKAGTTCDTPVVSMDFYPTIIEAAGLTNDEARDAEADDGARSMLDGESLMPLLKQTGKLKRDAVFFHYPNYAWHRSNRLGGAIRAGDYKLIERFDDGELELYNLADDLGEKHNLAAMQPDRAAALRDRLRAWRKDVDAAMPKPAK